MTGNISFFPVGNGDMTLITTESGRRILIDMNIRSAADDPDDGTPDVAGLLRDRLTKDSAGRHSVDVLLVSHPDQDHCRGLRKHFHLGPPSEWSAKANKIFVREIWPSPRVFRRASKNNPLCDDAKAFNREAQRRVRRVRHAWGAADRVTPLVTSLQRPSTPTELVHCVPWSGGPAAWVSIVSSVRIRGMTSLETCATIRYIAGTESPSSLRPSPAHLSEPERDSQSCL